MVRERLSREVAARRFWCVDRQGLLTADMAGQLHEYEAVYARPTAETKGSNYEDNGNGIGLAEVVRRVKPTRLIGASTVSESFTEAIVKEWRRTRSGRSSSLAHPLARAEANPADCLE